ncbi:MAG: porin family protein, partial [Pseudomonadota bacterium]
MKKLLLSFGLFGALLAGHANAADFIVAEPVPVAPEAPPADDWTGFYLGGHLGWAWDDAEWTFTNDSFWGDDGSGRSLDLDGFIGGGQAGYWHQFQNDFVLGADISASYTDLDGSFADDTVFRGTA